MSELTWVVPPYPPVNPSCSPASDAGELPSGLTSLVHLETTLLLLACQTSCQDHVHSRHQAKREFVFAALAAAADHRFENRCVRISGCCAFPVIWIDGDGKPSVSLGRCRDRLCPLCSAARGRESGKRTAALVATMDSARFITLTVPHRDRLLRDQLDQVMDMFRELRKTETWKHYVRGGVWALEITFNAETMQWHPHIHVIADGTYFPQPELKAEWSRIIGEEPIVDVRAVHSRRDAAFYIAKYVSKTVDLDTWTEVQIREYADAMHRRRTIHTFGNCHGVSTEADPADETPTPGTPTVGVWVLRRRMRLGDNECRRHAHALASSGGVLRMLLSDVGDDSPYLQGETLKLALDQAVTWLRSLEPLGGNEYYPPTPKPPPGPRYKDRTPPLPECH